MFLCASTSNYGTDKQNSVSLIAGLVIGRELPAKRVISCPSFYFLLLAWFGKRPSMGFVWIGDELQVRASGIGVIRITRYSAFAFPAAIRIQLQRADHRTASL